MTWRVESATGSGAQPLHTELNYSNDLRQWQIDLDPWQAVHLYSSADGLVASRMRSLAAGSSIDDLDWDGLAAFLRFGMFLGERTHLRHVRALRGGHRYWLKPDLGLDDGERIWHWPRVEPPASFEDAVDLFGDLLEAAVCRRLPEGPVALPLSGGLDSRCLLAAATRNTPPASLTTFSYGYTPTSIELEIGRQLAGRASTPHQSWVIDQYLPQRLDRAQELLEGFQDVFQARQLAFEPQLAEFEAVLGGHWGDVWFDSPGPIPPGTNTVDWLLDHWSTPGARDLMQVFDPALGDLGGRARGLLTEEWTRTAPDEEVFDRRYKIFKTEQWSARWTLASIRAYQGSTVPRLPYYDLDLASFALSLPGEYLRGRRLQVEYLKRHASQLADVEWQQAGASLFSLDHGARNAVRRAWRKAHRIVGRRRVVERNWEVQLAGAAGEQMLQRWLLQPELALRRLCVPGRLDAYVDRFRAHRDRETGSGVCRLITLSHWLETHVGG